MFEKRLPARKFRKYECTSRAALESKARNNAASDSDDASVGKKDGHGTVETIERVYGDEKGVPNVMEPAMNVA